MAAAEEGPEPLRYQTLALRVSIHCEGCRKKVKKVLHSIEGVYKTDIDAQQHKVVVIGNVSADALVKKLLKSGKHAEPWPEPAPAPPAAGSPPGPGGSPGSGGKRKKNKKGNNSPAAADNKPADPAPAPAPAEGDGGPSPPEQQDKSEGGASCDEASHGEQDKPDAGSGGNGSADAREAREESGASGQVAPPAMTPYGPQPIAPATNGNGNCGGGGGKKKGKKGGHGHGNANANANANGGNANANANGDGTGASATVEVHPPDAPTKPAAGNSGPPTVVDAGPYLPPPPPLATAVSYPGLYYAAGVHSPAYVMSYSTVHPSSALRSGAYYHPMAGAAHTPGEVGGYFYPTAPVSVSAAPGSYCMFSEEDASACSVM